MKLAFAKMGQGPALVIVHGLYGSSDNWMSIARHLSDSFTVYLVDQRNHGKSPHSSIHTYEAMSEDLKEFCDSETLEELYLIGHSMGGKTAITFTLNNPGMVKKIINVDISPFSYLEQEHFKEQINYHKTIVDAFLNAPLNSIKSRREMEEFFKVKISNSSTRKFLLKNLRRDKTSGFYWQLNIEAIAANLENIIDAAPPVKLGAQSFIPSLFIRGGLSPYVSDEEMEAIPDVFTNAKFVSFEKSGHWLHAEEPDRFVRTVLDFLQ